MKKHLYIIIALATFISFQSFSQESEKQGKYLIKLLKKFKGTKIEVIRGELFSYDEVKEIIGDKVDNISKEEYEDQMTRNLDRLVESAQELDVDWSKITLVEYEPEEMNEDGIELIGARMKFAAGDVNYKIKVMFVKYKGKYRLGELKSLYQIPEDGEYEYALEEAVEEAMAEEEAYADEDYIYSNNFITDTSFYGVTLGKPLDFGEDGSVTLIKGAQKVNGKYKEVYFVMDEYNNHIADVTLGDDGNVQMIEVFTKNAYVGTSQYLYYLQVNYLEGSYPEGQYETIGNKEYFRAGNIYFELGFDENNEPSEITKVMIKQ